MSRAGADVSDESTAAVAEKLYRSEAQGKKINKEEKKKTACRWTQSM